MRTYCYTCPVSPATSVDTLGRRAWNPINQTRSESTRPKKETEGKKAGAPVNQLAVNCFTWAFDCWVSSCIWRFVLFISASSMFRLCSSASRDLCRADTGLSSAPLRFSSPARLGRTTTTTEVSGVRDAEGTSLCDDPSPTWKGSVCALSVSSEFCEQGEQRTWQT